MFAAPKSGGSPITKYIVEADTASGFDSQNYKTFEIPTSDWDVQVVEASADVMPEIQSVTITDHSMVQEVVVANSGASFSQGGYVLSYNGRLTGCIAYNALDSEMETELEAAILASTGVAGGIASLARSGSNAAGYTYTIRFTFTTDVYRIAVEGVGASA